MFLLFNICKICAVCCLSFYFSTFDICSRNHLSTEAVSLNFKKAIHYLLARLPSSDALYSATQNNFVHLICACGGQERHVTELSLVVVLWWEAHNRLNKLEIEGRVFLHTVTETERKHYTLLLIKRNFCKISYQAVN